MRKARENEDECMGDYDYDGGERLVSCSLFSSLVREVRIPLPSVCVVEEVKTPKDFKSYDEYIGYTNYYSIFDENTLNNYYKDKKTVIIKMTYNAAFNRRIIRKELIEEIGISRGVYWGFFKLTNEQFNNIIERGQIDESLIVD